MKFVLAELLSELHLSMEHPFPEGFLQCWVWSSRPQLAALCWESLTYVTVLNYEKKPTKPQHTGFQTNMFSPHLNFTDGLSYSWNHNFMV